MENLLVQAACIIIAVHSAYTAFQLVQRARKPWLDILYRLSILVLALSFFF